MNNYVKHNIIRVLSGSKELHSMLKTATHYDGMLNITIFLASS